MSPTLAQVADDAAYFGREWLLDEGVRIAIVLAAALIVLLLSRIAVRRMQRRLEGAETLTAEINLRRVATLTQAVSYAVRVLVWTVASLVILGELGIALGPLIAGAGIAGVALGFGAQAVVRDFLSGFFILLENQFGVGDAVQVSAAGGTVSGRVEAVSLRTTWVRSLDGTLHVIPNGNIQVVGNRSRGSARAVLDLAVSSHTDVGTVRDVLQELFDELRGEEGLKDAFFKGPRFLGVRQVEGDRMVLRVVAETSPPRRRELERVLRRRIEERLGERGVTLLGAGAGDGGPPAMPEAEDGEPSHPAGEPGSGPQAGQRT